MIATLCFLDYATLPDFKSLEGTLRARYSSYAELLITVLPLLFAAVIYIRKASSRFMLVVIASAGWIVVMLSLSKGAFIAGIIGFLCFFALSLANGKPQFRRKILFLAGVWLTLTVAVQAGFSLLAPVPATVDYISGKTDATRETSTARVFFWRVGAEMARNDLLIGVGADNFGRTFNEARATFRVRSPDDPQDEIAGNNLVERSHNELLQIIAELGIVGLILFVTPFVLMAFAIFIKLVRQRKHASPLLWASVAGMTAFIVSSMVSSFSLRIVQNGIAFFIVTAVAVWIMTRKPSRTAANVSSLTFLAACLLILAMLVTFSLKGLAEFQVYRGMNNIDDSAAIEQFKTVAMLDPDYVSTSLLTADRLYKNKNYDEAATELRKAINGGLGVIVIYSSLAELEEKAGDIESADKTYNDGLKIFPRSVFLRVRYAKFLSDSGETVMADKQITLAKSFDERQTSGWFNLLNKGSIAAFYEAQANPQIALPAELKPESIVLRYLDIPPAEDEDK